MSIADAWEGALSNALMRLCKRNGISLELWTPAYVREWKENYAEQYRDDQGRSKWRKRAQPLKRMGSPEAELKQDMREYWSTKRAELVERVAVIPYFGNKPHALAAMVKLTEAGELNSRMTDDEVLTVMSEYGMKRADEKAKQEEHPA